jgi:hypothetical protein
MLGSSRLAARQMWLAGETSGFREARVGVLPPQMLRHLVWSTVSNSVALAALSNGTQVKSLTLEMNALLVARPVPLLECFVAIEVTARKHCWRVERVGHEERSKDLPVMRRSVGKSSIIPRVAPIGQADLA